jgi:hypothetical protein
MSPMLIDYVVQYLICRLELKRLERLEITRSSRKSSCSTGRALDRLVGTLTDMLFADLIDPSTLRLPVEFTEQIPETPEAHKDVQ